MHDEARAFVLQAVEKFGPFQSVVEFGGRDVNGSVRDLFGESYLSVDILPGPNVDVVADVRTWEPLEGFDCVVCNQVLEHVEDWPRIIQKAAQVLEPNGVFIVTTVQDPFPPHSGVDGCDLRENEHYAGVPREALREALEASGLVVEMETEDDSWEVQFVARRESISPEFGYEMCEFCGAAWKIERSPACTSCGRVPSGMPTHQRTMGV